MVRASGPATPFQIYINGLEVPPVRFPDFWIDRVEVTNREFKAFVDAGGYEKPEYWKHEFVKDGRRLAREEAMALFRDATGRTGPATWELGSYPAGREQYPVTGVSWYKAAAYAEFAGKSLPTIYHWDWVASYAAHVQCHPAGELRERRPRRGRQHARAAPVRNVRSRGKRQGVVCERSGGGQALHPRRRLGRATVHVPGRGRSIAPRALIEFRVPVCQVSRERSVAAEARGIHRGADPRLRP